VTDPLDRFERIIVIHQGLVIRWGSCSLPRRMRPRSTESSRPQPCEQAGDRRGDRLQERHSAGYYAAEAEGKRLEKQGSELAKACG
jgi:hypothetical protein